MENTNMGVMLKLAKARVRFLNQHVGKSGKNMQLEFKYFELEDIVPPALRIFERLGLATSTEFTENMASMYVWDTEQADGKPMVFCVPWRENDPIVNKSGREVTNRLQCLGSSITYLRRYLWMMVLDITEPDEVDARLGEDKGAAQPEEFTQERREAEERKPEKPKAAKKPATKAERAKAKEKLTLTTGKKGTRLLDEIRMKCVVLRAADPAQDEFTQMIAMNTQGFTVLDEAIAADLAKKLDEMIAGYPVEALKEAAKVIEADRKAGEKNERRN